MTCLLAGVFLTGCGASASKNEQQTNEVADHEQNATSAPTATEMKKSDATKKKETAKYTYKYHSNINTLIVEIKDQLPRLLTDNQDEIQKVIKEIMEIGSKELVATKIPPQTHTERDKKRNWNKNCKTSKSQGF